MTTIQIFLYLAIFPIANFNFLKTPAEIEEKGRIIGGLSASATQFPWIVEIRTITRKYDLIGRKWCGGSILTPNWIITSASCAIFSKSQYLIVAGAYDTLLPNFSTLQTRSVKLIKIHPKFNARRDENNIAIMRVHPAFIFDNLTVGNIQYTHFNFNSTGAAMIAGWGARVDDDSLGPRFLQYGVITLLENLACESIFPNRTILSTQICGTSTSSSPCFRDEGGPVMCDRNGILLLCGIISETNNCTRGLPPTIYTRAQPFYDWIQVGTTY